MMETGKQSISLTDKEKLYVWICTKIQKKEKSYAFSRIDKNCESYFEYMNVQPVLEEYDIRNRIDMEMYLDRYFDENLSEIKIECIRTFFKNFVHIEEDNGQRQDMIPKFIYNF